MATEEEKQEVRRQIEGFMRFAGVPFPWNGEVNESVAAVFDVVLRETAKCSRALGFVPRPPAGPATVAYLALQFTSGLYRQLRQRMSVSCARAAILKYRSEFEMATRGVYFPGITAWA